MMRPGNSVEAVEAASGRVQWRTEQAAKPLLASDGRLLCQVPTAETSTLQLVVIDSASGSSEVSRADVALPQGVAGSIDETLDGKFMTDARLADSRAVVGWEYQSTRIRAVPFDDTSMVTPADAQSVRPSTRRGYYAIDLGTGESALLDAPPAAYTTASVRNLWESSSVKPGPNQWLSRDGMHLLTSERVADDQTWAKYQWTITSTDTGNQLGRLRSHVSRTDFVVVDDTVLYVTEPYERRVGNKRESAELTLRAVSLRSGDQVWSRELRDTKFRGPYPP
ncbi:MAG: hypothetical protein AAFX44_04805 [Pseudomonadota bacterium]